MGTKNLLVATVAALIVAGCSKDAIRQKEAPEAPTTESAARASTVPELSRGRYAGVRHDPLPAGVAYEGGALVRIDAADYAFSRVRTPRGEMVWLDSVVPGRSQSPVKIVRAELAVPPLAHDERLVMASCDVNGRLDGRVVAIVVNEPNVTKLTKVRQAWRVDARRGRFDVIPVAGISCEDPGATTS